MGRCLDSRRVHAGSEPSGTSSKQTVLDNRQEVNVAEFGSLSELVKIVFADHHNLV